MTVIDLQDFCREADCIYEEERYSVRDNGAVLRHTSKGKRKRPADAQWTYGKPNGKTGYMEIASVRVHRIVATAFHGTPPTPEHVVDHIDTNRQNNRPENLRWLTRLENVLKNEITVKRIEFLCGSIEAFLADPSILRESKLDPNFAWMRTVSSEEAQACWKRMRAWAKSDKASLGGSLGEWVYQPIPITTPSAEATWEIPDLDKAREPVAHSSNYEPHSPQPAYMHHNKRSLPHTQPNFRYEPRLPDDLVVAKTQYAVQRNWRTPSEFPFCPQEYSEEAIPTYAARLKAGAIFSRNDFLTSVIIAFALSDDQQSLWVMCEFKEQSIKPWTLAQVTFEDGLYVHANLGSFFHKEGAEKRFCLAQGREWTGGDSIDDYC